MHIARHFTALWLMICTSTQLAAQPIEELTTAQAAAAYATQSKQRVSIHDPAAVWDSDAQTLRVFGTHRSAANSSDLQHWQSFTPTWSPANSADAFRTNRTTSVNIGGRSTSFGNFDAYAWANAYGQCDISTNMWAPDVIYNPTMRKWCMYLSVNGSFVNANIVSSGQTMNSVIILLTAASPEGPYTYQGPVVYSGFGVSDDTRTSWKLTDLELVIGQQASLPARYRLYSNWSNTWTNCIDPCVFYDADGKLWMAYGSWFGGIWALELDEQTGLRDYSVSYGSDYDARGENVTLDPYFGKKLHGGHGVSGEGPYIERIGSYYYLFLSYGWLEASGGYQMRVFRSENPDGPYTDGNGINAIYDSYRINYGPGADHRGEKLLGSYAKWGWMATGEVAQGHNSIATTDDGRHLLVYHTRFDNGSADFEMRVHQLFVNQDGWPVVAPFEYNGETTTDTDLRSTQHFGLADVAGSFDLLIHSYDLNHTSLSTAQPERIHLGTDGRITGTHTGTWTLTDGTGYITLQIDGVEYKGVVLDEQMDFRTTRAIAITACSQTGVNVWAYRLQDKYSLAYQVNNQGSLPLHEGMRISRDINLSSFLLTDMPGNVEASLSSERTDILSNSGRVNLDAVSQRTDFDVSLLLTSGHHQWKKTFRVYVQPKGESSVVGNTDNSSAYASDFSEDYQIEPGQQLTLQFENYTDKAQNWHNWICIVSNDNDRGTSAYEELVTLRADGWNNATNSSANISGNGAGADNWATFRNKMDGATVTLTITHTGTNLTIHADEVASDGTTFVEDFTYYGIGTRTLRVSMTVEHAHLVIDNDATTLGTIVGNTDNTANYADHVFSPDYTLKPSHQLTLQFKNYSRQINNWDNWLLYASSEDKSEDYFQLRADAWEVVSKSSNGIEHNFGNLDDNTSTFKSDLNGADITLKVSREGSLVRVRADILTMQGKELYETYQHECGNAAQNIVIRLSVEGSHLIIDNTKTTDLLVLDENVNYIPLAETTAVQLNRSVKSGLNTLVLPFSLTQTEVEAAFGAGSKAYTVDDAQSVGGDIYFATSDGISANMPVLLNATEAGTSYNFDEATVEAGTPSATGSNVSFVGSYQANTTVETSENNFVLSSGQLYVVDTTSGLSMKGFRAYFVVPQTAGAKSLRIRLAGDTPANAIEGIETIRTNDPIYNMAGQRINQLQRGINIVKQHMADGTVRVVKMLVK